MVIFTSRTHTHTHLFFNIIINPITFCLWVSICRLLIFMYITMNKGIIIGLVWSLLNGWIRSSAVPVATYRPWKRELQSGCTDQTASDTTIESLVRDGRHSACQWLLEYDHSVTAPQNCPGSSLRTFMLPDNLQGKIRGGLYMIDTCTREEEGLIIQGGKCQKVVRKEQDTEIPARDYVWLDDHFQAVHILAICVPPWNGKLLVVPKASQGDILPPDYAISPRVILESSTCSAFDQMKMKNPLANQNNQDLDADIQYNIVRLLKSNRLADAKVEMAKLRSTFASKSPMLDAVMMADTTKEVKEAVGSVASDCRMNTLRYIAIGDVCQHMNRIAFQIGPGQFAPSSKIAYILINQDRLMRARSPVRRLCDNINVRALPLVKDLNSLCDPIEAANVFPVPRLAEVGTPMMHSGHPITRISVDLPLPDGEGFVAVELFTEDTKKCEIDDLIPPGYYITVVIQEKYSLTKDKPHSGQMSRYNSAVVMSTIGLIMSVMGGNH